jgi:glycosyltransferase involved in cell wall biosynthesis
MSTRPRFSVVIPTYNREAVVGDAIRSVLNQTFKRLEVIVVDDYSTDDTKEVIRSIDDTRIRYTTNNRSKGAQGARNTGINKAKGEWISFLDSDDIWVENKMETEINYLESRKDRIHALSSGYYISKNDKIFWESSFSSGEFLDEGYLLHSNPIGSFSSLTVKRNTLLSIGGLDESLPALQDRDLLFRICKDYKIHTTKNRTVIMRASEGDRISDNINRLLDSSIRLKEKYENFLKGRKDVEVCMRADISRLSLVGQKWGMFFKNVMYLPASALYCSDKIAELFKSVMLSSSWIKSIQVKLCNMRQKS